MNEHKYINPILEKYYKAFKEKTYSVENNDTDVLMDIFGITPEQKGKQAVLGKGTWNDVAINCHRNMSNSLFKFQISSKN